MSAKFTFFGLIYVLYFSPVLTMMHLAYASCFTRTGRPWPLQKLRYITNISKHISSVGVIEIQVIEILFLKYI